MQEEGGRAGTLVPDRKQGGMVASKADIDTLEWNQVVSGTLQYTRCLHAWYSNIASILGITYSITESRMIFFVIVLMFSGR